MITQISNQMIFAPAYQKENTVRARSIAVKADDYKLSLVFSEQRKIGEETNWHNLATVQISSMKLYELGAAFLEPIHAAVKRNLFAANIKELPSDGILLRASYVLQDMYVLRAIAGFKQNGDRKERFLKLQLFKAPSWQWLQEKRNLDKNKTDWGDDNIIFNWDLTGQYPANGLFSTTTDLLFIKSLAETCQDIHLCRNTTWQAHKSAVYEANKSSNKTSTPDAESNTVQTEMSQAKEIKEATFEVDEEFPF